MRATPDMRAAAGSGRNTTRALGSFAPTLTAGDESLRQRLLSGLASGAGNELERLTQMRYRSDFEPDVLAVRTGKGVTPQFAGGHDTVQIAMFGANITFFGTGEPPSAAKGVAITFGPEATAADRKAATDLAQSYLEGHLSDAKDSSGRWNQPTFDMFV